jgi:hypothetical protein
MCWSQYEDRWTVEDEAEREKETRRVLDETEEATAREDERERELVEA